MIRVSSDLPIRARLPLGGSVVEDRVLVAAWLAAQRAVTAAAGVLDTIARPVSLAVWERLEHVGDLLRERAQLVDLAERVGSRPTPAGRLVETERSIVEAEAEARQLWAEIRVQVRWIVSQLDVQVSAA